YEAKTAKTTASANGTKRKRATPERKNIGIKTMQMQNLDEDAGNAISPAPTMIAGSSSSPAWVWRSMFSIVTVASSTRIPTASARPPSVMRLMVSPNALKAAREASTESGIDTATMSVLLHEPRNNRIIKAVKQAAITP